MMNGTIPIVILAFVLLTVVNLRAQQFNFDYINFNGNVGAVSSASSFASSSSVVFSNDGFADTSAFSPQAQVNAAITNSGNMNDRNKSNGNKNKNNQGRRGSSQAKPKRNTTGGANKAGNAVGKRNAVSKEYASNPFLTSAVTSKPAPASKSRPTTRKPPSAGQRNKPPKSPAATTKKPSATQMNKKNKKNNSGNSRQNANAKAKGKGKKRVSQIKYEQYLSSVYPDLGNEGVEEVTDFNGRELAQPGQFPHMGAIGFRNTVLNKTEYKCGASLISSIFVVTSAHCTEFNGLAPTYVRFGDLNLRAGEENVDPQTRQIAQIINHPAYMDNSLYNDIALLQLAKPIIFTEFVRPIRLWYRDYIPFTNAFAMGFGAVQFAGAATNRLTEFNLTIVPNDICGKQLPKQSNAEQGIIESQICAIDLRKKASDTFQGDSGGPLQVSFQGRRWLHEYLIGVTSFGVLGITRYPGVYTRISSFVDWIEQIVWSSEYNDYRY